MTKIESGKIRSESQLREFPHSPLEKKDYHANNILSAPLEEPSYVERHRTIDFVLKMTGRAADRNRLSMFDTQRKPVRTNVPYYSFEFFGTGQTVNGYCCSSRGDMRGMVGERTDKHKSDLTLSIDRSLC